MQNVLDSEGQDGRSFIEKARRAQIIAAAAETVAAVGYAKASLTRIAQQAGISKGVITYHFTNKDEILRLVATQFFDNAWAYMEQRIEREDTAAGQLRAWVGAELEYFANHRTQFLAMTDIVTNHRNQDGGRAFANEFGEEITGLQDILTQGQHDGQLRDFDAYSVANIILRTIDGLLASWAWDPTVDLAAEAPVLLDFIDHAIRAEPS